MVFVIAGDYLSGYLWSERLKIGRALVAPTVIIDFKAEIRYFPVCIDSINFLFRVGVQPLLM